MIADDAILTVAAQAADGDDTAAAILLDLLLENPKQTEWRDERVMMLCLGVPLIPVAPGHLGMQGRRNWHRQRGASIAFASPVDARSARGAGRAKRPPVGPT